MAYSTFRNYPSLLKTTILPSFEGKNLNQITKRHVSLWWSRHADHKVNRRNAYYDLKGIFALAVEWELLVSSPTQIKDAGKDESKLRADWSLADFDVVLEHVDAFYRPALEVMIAGHYRLGELVAVNGSDVRHGFVSSTRQRSGLGYTGETKIGQHKNIELLKRGARRPRRHAPGHWGRSSVHG